MRTIRWLTLALTSLVASCSGSHNAAVPDGAAAGDTSSDLAGRDDLAARVVDLGKPNARDMASSASDLAMPAGPLCTKAIMTVLNGNAGLVILSYHSPTGACSL